MKKVIFFLWLVSVKVFAQKESVFKGELTNIEDLQSVTFAHFQSEQGGFISNQQGSFHFVVDDTIDSLHVFISAIGYASKEVYLTSSKENTIHMQPIQLSLEEVILDYEDPAVALVKKVIQNIPQNYPNQFEQLYGEINESTYWDSLKTKPIYKASARTRSDKFSYSKKNSFGNVELLDENVILYDFDSLDLRFYAGVHRVHYGDFVKARKDILEKNKVKNFDLAIQDTLTYNNLNVIRLNYKNNLIKGIVHVDVENYAIVRVERFVDPSTVKEPLGFLLRHQRSYYHEIIDYSRGEDDKWRINFMHYETGFKYKKVDKEIHLDNTYFLQKIEKGKEVIPLNRRIKYTDVLLNKIDLELPKTKNKREKIFRFFDRLRSAFSLSLLPIKINAHRLEAPMLGINMNFENETKVLYAYQFRYDYSFKNNWGVNLIGASSLEKQEYESYALGFWKENEIDMNGRWRYEISTAFENRKLRINHGRFKFQEPFSYEGKKFDSGELNRFSEQRDFGVNMKFSLNFRCTEKTIIGLFGSYFFPINSQQGLYLEEKKEFWFWNKSKFFDQNALTTSHDKIIENDFQMGLNFMFRF